ncbi:MAG: SpoIID/LytB domain-containing protein [Myxococcota bacterium]
MTSLLLACGFGAPDEGSLAEEQNGAVPALVSHPIAAACTVHVTGVGTMSMEDDYLPRVIRCENGGADLEALKAQAIAARSVAYYEMARDGEICDSQSCQVFSCGVEPSPIHYEAVRATSGMYMSYNGNITYGFYVAGDRTTSEPDCQGSIAADSTGTERYVRYNQGRFGTDVAQTNLGLVISPSNALYGQNRGCMSQWGARCLEAERNFNYMDILRFYYGEDIEVYQAQGSCIQPVAEPSECACAGGWYHNGDRIPLTSTYCGMRVCGGGNALYECTAAGWSQVPGESCGFGQSSCALGVDYKGHHIDPEHTESGVRACGLDHQFWECEGTSWTPTGASCPLDNDGASCRCENGLDQAGNPIDPGATFCGFDTCGVAGRQWRCTGDGWVKVNDTCDL